MGLPIQKKWFGFPSQILVTGVKFKDGTTASGAYILKQTGSTAYKVQDAEKSHLPETVFLVNATSITGLKPGECYILGTPYNRSPIPCQKITQFRISTYESNGTIGSYTWGTTNAGSPTQASLLTTTPQMLPLGSIQTFDYVPARDGLALLSGGPSLAGYAANLASNLSRKWVPRIQNGDTATNIAKGVIGGADSFEADPEYAWSNGFTPFLFDANGNLIIRARKISAVTPAFAGGEIPNNTSTGVPFTWITGSMVSDPAFRQYGGYFEIECKVNTSKAVWPAFWTLTDYPYTKRAEVDIMERVGDTLGTNTYHLNVVQSDAPTQDALDYNTSIDQGTGFHRYGAMITDTQIKFYFDGNLVRTSDISNKPKFNDACFMILTNPVGTELSSWVGHPDGTTNDPADFVIRSVKVWQRPGPVSLNLGAISYLDNVSVGGIVTTLSTDIVGNDTDVTFSIVSDTDNMFSIDNTSKSVSNGKVSVNLKLTQLILATTKASHNIRLSVIDSSGRTFTRSFIITAITATPIQSNYITTQDLTNAFWSKNNVTATATQLLETNATAVQHSMFASNKTRAAGIKTFTYYMEVEPIGRNFMKLQIMDAAFGSNQAIANFDLGNVSTGFSTAVGTWSNVVPFIIPIPGTSKFRIGMDFTTDGTSTNFTFSPQIQPDSVTNSYNGDITKGMKITSTWCFNKNAGAGGT